MPERNLLMSGIKTALRTGHFLRRGDLRRCAEQTVELGDRVPGDLVVKALLGLGCENQSEAVLARP